jgi:GxxExxY protein
MAVDELYKHSEVTDKIIRAFYNVYNTLGYGFLEKVYENAMMIELRKLGLQVKAQQPVNVYYGEECVGNYFSDIEVNGCVICELKAAEVLAEEHEAQLLNYLKATQIEIGMLLNFGKKAEFKKKIFSNEYKKRNTKVEVL